MSTLECKNMDDQIRPLLIAITGDRQILEFLINHLSIKFAAARENIIAGNMSI